MWIRVGNGRREGGERGEGGGGLLSKRMLQQSTPHQNLSTVKPRFTAVFGGKETSAVNRGPRLIGVLFGLHYVCLDLFGGKEMAAVYRGLR